ncbi:MAG: hypothetical protein CME26_06405 [Gemmatimonadetes bacterium]|nr:hypothetical protein [Gemmatimonadota bacterium]
MCSFLCWVWGTCRGSSSFGGEPIFHQAAIDAVKQFVFEPATQNDKPVPVWMSQVISFDLEETLIP